MPKPNIKISPNQLGQVLFLDIETVPVFHQGDRGILRDIMPDKDWAFYQRYCQDQFGQEDPTGTKMGLVSEFSNVICISFGVWRDNQIFTTSIYSAKEGDVITKFSRYLRDITSNFTLGGWNVKGFDLPYLTKKCVRHGKVMPQMLDFTSAKPWEYTVWDVKELFKFNSWAFKAPSLDLCCHYLGLPSPKAEIDGSQVGTYFYKNSFSGKGPYDLKRDVPEVNSPRFKMARKVITTYCEGDVASTIQCCIKLLACMDTANNSLSIYQKKKAFLEISRKSLSSGDFFKELLPFPL